MTRDEYLYEYGNSVTSKANISITDKDGNAVHFGDTVTDFRGDTAILLSASRFHSPELGKTGKVCVDDGWGCHNHEYYDHVFGLKVELVEVN